MRLRPFRIRTLTLAIAAGALTAIFSAVGATHAEPTTPTTAPAIDDPGTFARLYPELARADKAVRAATPRIVFDALDSRGKPALKLPRMDVLYQAFTDASWKAFLAGRRLEPFVQVPDERRVRIATIDAKRKGASLCFDIETLPLDLRFSNADDIDRSVRLLAKVVGWARVQDPNVRVFFYGGTPAGDNYLGSQVAGAATTRPEGANYRWWKDNLPKWEAGYLKWQGANALLRRAPESGAHEAAASLGSLFDGSCPSLYITYDPAALGSTEGIAAWVRSHVDEARRYGKPVYPFVSFYLFDGPHVVPLNQWTLMIREIVTHADGVVLWDGPNAWDDRMTLRVRIATMLAERKGEMNDDELYAALRKELPADAELKALAGVPAATTQQTR